MNSKLMDGSEWLLISAAVLLLAALHRVDLIAIVVPVALLAAYFLSGSCETRHSRQRKI